MRTFITQCDLSQSLAPIWWPEDYWQAMILIRYKRRPLGVLHIGKYYHQQITISRQQLEQEIFQNFGFLPATQAIIDKLDLLSSAKQTEEVIPSTSNDSGPAISVVVCTRDRPQALRRCLEALGRLDYEKYEVIVVDNASTNDETREVVSPTPFRYVQENQPGLSWARNRGLAEARYDIIAYVDDDVLVDPGWLKGVADAFADPQMAAMTGLVLPAELETPAQQLTEQYAGMGKGFQTRLFQGQEMCSHDLIAVQAVGVGANMAFRRTVFETIGAFDTALGVGTSSGGGEDLDIFHRVLTSGLTLRYQPTALVWHQHRRDMEGLNRQLYNNGRAFAVYLMKVWLSNSVGRYKVMRFACGWVVGWLLARLLNRLFGRLDFPLALVWAELWGALQAPWAYFATYYHDRKIRESTNRQYASVLEKVQV